MKLWRSKPWTTKAIATTSGMVTFHHTTMVFVSRNQRMPAAFNAVNPSRTNTATSSPSGVSRTTPGRLRDQRGDVVADIAQRGLRLDRRHADGTDPREPAGEEPGYPSEGIEGKPRRPAVDREHRPELGVDKGQDHDQQCAQDPGGDRAAPAADLGGVERREEPARPDDRSHRHEDKGSPARERRGPLGDELADWVGTSPLGRSVSPPGGRYR